jgi:two-component system sensor histidine kinase YcbA
MKKSDMRNLQMKEKLLIYLFMIISVPLAGEFKFYPLEGDLRVSLGTPVFFLLLLWSKKTHPVVSGFLVGSAVVCFRLLLASINVDNVVWNEVIPIHFPVFFYYLTFASLFHLLRVKAFYDKPFLIGILGVFIEIVSSVMEISFRSIFLNNPLTLYSFGVIGLIAVFRSFFVLGFFNILILRDAKLAEEVQRKRNEQLLMHISNLYVEMVQLKKSMKNAEEVTRACYSLYREMKEQDEKNPYTTTILAIAGQVHEMKKDNQRIHAGLSKLMEKEQLDDFMKIEEIIDIVVTTNEKYGLMLEKNIDFEVDIRGEHGLYHTFILLSIINNLVSNAVEASKEAITISIETSNVEDTLAIRISDNGPGIPERHRDLIFQAGFTTKYNESGVASNGIGLTYVKDVVEHLNGSIELEDLNGEKKTSFLVQLPIQQLMERGE